MWEGEGRRRGREGGFPRGSAAVLERSALLVRVQRDLQRMRAVLGIVVFVSVSVSVVFFQNPTSATPLSQRSALSGAGEGEGETCSGCVVLGVCVCFFFSFSSKPHLNNVSLKYQVTLHGEFNRFADEGMREDQVQGRIGHSSTHSLSPGSYKYFFMVDGRRRFWDFSLRSVCPYLSGSYFLVLLSKGRSPWKWYNISLSASTSNISVCTNINLSRDNQYVLSMYGQPSLPLSLYNQETLSNPGDAFLASPSFGS